jgi:hypothetical protein
MYINPVCNATIFFFTFLLHTVACVILMHLNAVWQFRQIQTPEDGHIGPEHVVLKESKGEK